MKYPHISPTAAQPVTANPWEALREFTDARIALGRAGISLPTRESLAFQLDHAKARDAVHQPLDVAGLQQRLSEAGFACLSLHSAASDRQIYLQRPDLGRQLDESSRTHLTAFKAPPSQPKGYDLAIVVADGLSALAVEQNTLPFLQALTPRLDAEQWVLAPVCLVQQGRVAIGDDIAQRLNADAVVMLIGERPGLSSPDSLGLYLTWAPRVGLTDASRNCISNVRPAGMSYANAAYRLHYLLSEARRRKLSGVALKDETVSETGTLNGQAENFLIAPPAR